MDDLGVAVLNTSSHSEDEDSPPAESREVEDDVSASASFKDPLPKSMTAQEKKIKQQRLDRIRRLNLALESPTEEMIAKRTNTLLDLTKSSNKALMTSPLTPATPVTSTSTSLASLFMSEEADTPILNSPRPSSSRSTPSDWNKENLVPTSDHETTPKSSLGIPPLKSVSSNSQRKASPELALMKKPEVPRSKARKRLGIFENGCRRSMSLEDVDQGSSAPKIRKQQTSYIVKNANPKFHRSYSETNATAIMNACNRSSSSVLTADAAQKLALPTLSLKKHQDLNTIDSHTVAKLIRGEFASSIASYRIIDARYVYEFEGGHIKGAENFGLWEEETFFEEFLPSALKPLPPGSHEANQENQFAMRKNVLIFHCEFSSKRGPALARDLRRR